MFESENKQYTKKVGVMEEAKQIIVELELIPHPEGGFFREVYRSDEFIDKQNLPFRYNSNRYFSTSIYYLLVGKNVSHFHRIKSDEVWHFYKGSNLIIHCLDESKGYTRIKIGSDILSGTNPQHTIKKGTWFAAEIEDKNSYSLIGCTVAPGFEYDDFELASRSKLINLFPKEKELITRLTIENN